MIINIRRFHSTKDETCGMLYVNGRFQCFTLEDEYRDNKVPSETRIPAGEYDIEPRYFGVFREKYLKRFGPSHTFMLEVVNSNKLKLPDGSSFSDILFHCGNSDDDTAGCILLGDTMDLNDLRAGATCGFSARAYMRFYELVAGVAMSETSSVKLRISDEDGYGKDTINIAAAG